MRGLVLSNGMRVRVVDREGPLCAVRLLMPCDEGARGDLATAALLGFELLDGTRDHDGFTMRRLAGEAGAFLDTTWTPEWIAATLSVRPPLARGLDLLAEIVTRPAFPPREFEAQRAYLSSLAEESSTRRADVANRVLRETLFGATHPYGKVSATAAELRAVKREDVLRAYAHLVDPERAILVLAGACGGADVDGMLEHTFGGIPRRVPSGPTPSVPPTPRLSRRLVLVDASGDPQADVSVAAIVPPVGSESWFTGVVAAQVLSARASRRIVQEAALSDDVRVMHVGYKNAAWVVARATVRLEKAATTLMELERLFGYLRTAPPEEVAAAQRRALLADAGGYERAADIAASVATHAFEGGGLDEFTRYRAMVRESTAAKVHAFGEAFLSADETVGVVVGDRTALAPELGRLPWGGLEVRDRAGTVLPP
jgi:zinc protease